MKENRRSTGIEGKERKESLTGLSLKWFLKTVEMIKKNTAIYID